MSVEWTLPIGAARFGTTAQIPADSRVWGDCVFLVEHIAGKTTELLRTRLNSDSPSIELNVVLPPSATTAKLRVTVQEGERGPIQDRVTLLQPLLIIATDAPARIPG